MAISACITNKFRRDRGQTIEAQRPRGLFDYFSFGDALAVLQPGFANAFGWCLGDIVTEYSDGMGRQKLLYDKSRTHVGIPACKATQLMLSHSEPHLSFRCGQQTISYVIIAFLSCVDKAARKARCLHVASRRHASHGVVVDDWL